MAVVSCDSGGGGSGGSGGSGGGASGTGGAGGGDSLTWYTTCGDPVCGAGGAGGAMAPPGTGPCTTEQEGGACTTAGAQCWPGGDCGVLLLCATSDPKASGCPISRARAKKDIDYLREGALQSIHDDLMTMRLATWRYTSETAQAREHLGFLIDDNPESPAVMASGERVDLYGYTSMAVAAAQVQDKRLHALEREISALREEIAALRGHAGCEPKR